MFTEEEYIVYVVLCDCPVFSADVSRRLRHAGYDPSLSDEEALTLEIVGEYLLGSRAISRMYRYFRYHYREWVSGRSDRSTLVRQCRTSGGQIWDLAGTCPGERGLAWFRFSWSTLPRAHLSTSAGGLAGDVLDDSCINLRMVLCAKGLALFASKAACDSRVAGWILAAPIFASESAHIDLLDTLLLGVLLTPASSAIKVFLPGAANRTARRLGTAREKPRQTQYVRPELFLLHPLENRLRRWLKRSSTLAARFHSSNDARRKGWTFGRQMVSKILTHTICVFTNSKYGYPQLNWGTVHD